MRGEWEIVSVLLQLKNKFTYLNYHTIMTSNNNNDDIDEYTDNDGNDGTPNNNNNNRQVLPSFFSRNKSSHTSSHKFNFTFFCTTSTITAIIV